MQTADQDLAIEACTKIISSGTLGREQLAVAYFNRGTASAIDIIALARLPGTAILPGPLYQRAIADLTKAIELMPDFAQAYNNRGNTYLTQHEESRASADFQRAAQL